MAFPFISVIIFTPFVAGMLILMLPADRKAEVKVIAAAAAFISLILSLWLFFTYDREAARLATDWAGRIQFEEKIAWVPSLGLSYHVGGDGFNIPLLLLTSLILFAGVLVSWHIEHRAREFFAFLMVLATGIFGGFAALDLFLLVFFYEMAIFPIYVMIAVWGSTRKEFAAMKLTLYILVGSIIALVGLFAIYFKAGLGTFDMVEIYQRGNLDATFQRIWFLPVFVGFGVLASLWPFHVWSPDGYVAAPTVVSMLHAGVLKNMGAYVALRTGIQLMPEGARFWMPFIVFLTVVNIVYAAMVAMSQRDFKYVFGFASVGHMGIVLLGFSTLNLVGLTGTGVQMFIHGAMSAIFFSIVGMVYDRAHTRDIPSLGGFVRIMPIPTLAFLIAGLSSMGMPGLAGFVAEIQIFIGVWLAYAPQHWWFPWLAVVASTGVIITAAYILRVAYNVFFGELRPEFADLPGVTLMDKIAVTLLAIPLIVIGVYPSIIMPLAQTGAASIASLFGGA
ncbi:MAG: NADH-quinone oxidoreductase subunit M [Chloroflexi bacterium]|nr:MAG: NADH-quinone oxidoreductase subunit M [Chloroflexota bacterium]